jgi:hypothetical protein
VHLIVISEQAVHPGRNLHTLPVAPNASQQDWDIQNVSHVLLLGRFGSQAFD